MNVKRMGTWFVLGGLLLMAAALCLTVYNLNEQTRGAQAAANVLRQMEEEKTAPIPPTPTAEAEQAPPEPQIPAYLRDPHMDMPEVEIEGQKYIGILSIPALELRLPVLSEWSYALLRVAPCRFEGSAYLDDLILMAHNYASHFGMIGKLQMGDDVYFEDGDGNVFRYQVAEVETLTGMQRKEMESGDWDLTLFTCTVTGKYRVTVRCERAKES